VTGKFHGGGAIISTTKFLMNSTKIIRAVLVAGGRAR
jgi:hypothetical protein